MISDETMTKAAAIYRDVAGYPIVPARHFDALRAACVAIRNAALEEAAELSERLELNADDVPAAIRALKEPT